MNLYEIMHWLPPAKRNPSDILAAAKKETLQPRTRDSEIEVKPPWFVACFFVCLFYVVTYVCLRVFVFVGVCGMWLISRRRRLFLMLFFVSDRCSLKTDISGNCRRNHYQEDAHTYQDYDLLLINLHGFCSKRDLLLSTLAYTCFFLFVT